jgi:hypothetical protein
MFKGSRKRRITGIQNEEKNDASKVKWHTTKLE